MGRKDIDFKIEGIAQVDKMLKDLPLALNQSIMRDVNKAAAKIAKAQLEEDTPVGDNDKKQSDKAESNVTIVNDKKSKTGGVLLGFKKRSWYILLQEIGTKVRQLTGKGKYKSGNRGKIERKPFILESHQKAFPAVIEFMQKNYLKIVNKSLKKNARKFNKAKR